MIYLEEESKYINKYNVTFNKKKIEELKRKIILDCGIIKHREIESDCFPGFKDRDLIFNYTSEPVGEQEYFEETRTIYLHKFDEYIPPKLVEYINQLLAKDNKGIINLVNYDSSCEYSDFEYSARLEKKQDEYSKIPEQEIRRRIEKLQEIDELIKHPSKDNELLKKREILTSYYKELMTLIKLEFVDSLPLIDKRRVEAFYNIKIGYKEVKEEGKQKKKTK